eukprot:TRINITY_DN5677_c0_g1_i1.p1 TRINITY_DN5677_c0_g1~~TRINITY_DN5677_c0_g1_i1.p1  ORF type:complete len:182 (-),score=38.70 TRINITY_DN5677_c0_g1_i1:22-567(-)
MLLCLYGFVPATNSCEKVCLDVQVAEAVEAKTSIDDTELKHKILRQQFGITACKDFFAFPGGEISWNCTTYVRVLLMNREETASNSHLGLLDSEERISADNERATRELLSCVARSCLRTLRSDTLSRPRKQSKAAKSCPKPPSPEEAEPVKFIGAYCRSQQRILTQALAVLREDAQAKQNL